MNAEELNLAYNFAFKHFKDCDEFVNNVFHLDLIEAPSASCAVGTRVECAVLEFTSGA